MKAEDVIFNIKNKVGAVIEAGEDGNDSRYKEATSNLVDALNSREFITLKEVLGKTVMKTDKVMGTGDAHLINWADMTIYANRIALFGEIIKTQPYDRNFNTFFGLYTILGVTEHHLEDINEAYQRA